MKSKEKLRERAFDESWKKVLDKFFWQFLDFYFPKIAKNIDRSKGYKLLEKELAKITRESESKSRRVDKLASVHVKGQGELWILVHIEIQSYEDTKFSSRMLLYFVRIWERYQRPVASLAILTDTKEDFRPNYYKIEALGEEFLNFKFPISKLLDYKGKEEELEKNDNPFAIVTLASLKTYEKNDNKRFVDKCYLTKMLYNRGYSKETIIELYEFLDGIIVLPEKMEKEYHKKVYEYEEEKNMPYISTAERIGSQKRAQKAILEVLEARFKTIPEDIKKEVSLRDGEEELTLLLKEAATIESLEKFSELLFSQ